MKDVYKCYIDMVTCMLGYYKCQELLQCKCISNYSRLSQGSAACSFLVVQIMDEVNANIQDVLGYLSFAHGKILIDEERTGLNTIFG